jgi:1,4-dihydroxy-2-naphthoate polyprenyltransferase
MNSSINNSTLNEGTTTKPMSKFKAILSLTRWREHVPYTIPCVVGGAMMAIHQTNGMPDVRLLAVVFANILAQSFAFMINDVADAPDDALNPKKKARNVISNGTLSPREGMMWTWGTFFVALALFAIGGLWVAGLGLLQLVLCYLYSAYPFRWKARLVTDVLSHALMLSALLVMTGFFIYSSVPNQAWFMFGCAFFFSAYGQFFNQLDDYDVDKAAGLRNTVVVLGKSGTKTLMYICAIIAVACACGAILTGVFPSWLASIALIAIFSCTLFIWETDMRGNKAEGSGVIQKPGLLMLNIVMLTWLVQTLGLLQF